MVNKEYIISKMQENPEIRFYDIRYPNKSIVEIFDNENASNSDAIQKLSTAMDNLTGSYIITLKSKSRKETGKGGTVRPEAEYNVTLGSPQNYNQGLSGIPAQGQNANYMEKYLDAMQEFSNKKFEYEMKILKLEQQLEALKNGENSGVGSALESVFAQVLAKQYLNVDIAPTNINGVKNTPVSNNIYDNDLTDQEQELTAAVLELIKLNPGALDMLKNLNIYLSANPQKIQPLNEALKAVAHGGNLMAAFSKLL